MLMKLYKNRQFRNTFILKMGEGCEPSQFPISPNAAVTAALKSINGETTYATVTLAHNANKNDFWLVSKLDVIFPATETANVQGENVVLEINVDAPYVDRTGSDTTDTYEQTWEKVIPVVTAATI